MRTRMQKGYVWRVGEWWWIRYADTRIEDGVAVRKPGVSQKLCAVAPEHRRMKRPPEVVEQKQAEFMEKINACRDNPERASTLGEFVTQIWFPTIENRHAASTVHVYRGYWKHSLAPRCGPQLLRDFSTPEAQRVLEGIARDNPEMTTQTEIDSERDLQVGHPTGVSLGLESDARNISPAGSGIGRNRRLRLGSGTRHAALCSRAVPHCNRRGCFHWASPRRDRRLALGKL